MLLPVISVPETKKKKKKQKMVNEKGKKKLAMLVSIV